MRPLEQALVDHDLIVLRMLGEWCELDLTGTDKAGCVAALAEELAGQDMGNELTFLPPEESAALKALVGEGGRMPVATFRREHGEVRLMGPGRLEREEPWLDPSNPAEGLWYRGFLYRAFDETEEGLVEFYYLPTELFAQLAPAGADRPAGLGAQPASPFPAADPPARATQPQDDAVDDLTTMLAFGLQAGLQPENIPFLRPLLRQENPDRRSLLITLAWEMGLLRQTPDGARPTRDAVNWLQASREAQLRALAEAWSSSAWNDLRHTPALICEGSGWENDPILARSALLDILPRTGEWHRLADVVDHLHATDPDFQRPDGNYDTWYIRERGDTAYLTGFDSWQAVEGRLLRFLIEGPLQWLGMSVTAAPGADGRPTLFRLADRALSWLKGTPAPGDEIRVPPLVQPDATLIVPHNANRYHRFQIARVAEPQPYEPGQPYLYQLTPQSLASAADQGIGVARILDFLTEAGERPLPPGTRRALTRWAERGTEGRIDRVRVLRVRDAAILTTLRENDKTRPYIGEALGDMAALVADTDWSALVTAAAQLGLLLDAGGAREERENAAKAAD